MEKAIEALQRNFGRVRTGRASLSLLDGVRVEYYGTPTPLNQVGQPLDSRAAPDRRPALGQDPHLRRSRRRSCSRRWISTPRNDGNLVRIPIPKLTEERRKELVKVVKGMTEDARVAMRNARRDANSELRPAAEGQGDLRGRLRRHKDEVQKVTDQFVKRADELSEKKEAEILEV